MIPGTVLLAGVVGSVAYGLQTTLSDIDRLGVYAAPTEAFHGLYKPVESWRPSPDVMYHEAAKWLRLALNGNPSVMELVWLDAYEIVTPLGAELVAIRRSFLSAERVRDAYLRYADGQFRRLRARGDGTFSSGIRTRTAKHARHLWRLLYQGAALYRTGELVIRLPPGEAAACRAFGDRVAAGDLAVVEAALQAAERAFAVPTMLPSQPDEAAAQAWLLRVRAAMLPAPTADTRG